MARKGAINQTDSFAETCASIISGVISFFLSILVVVFPLIYHKSYTDILETKYKCYYLSTLGMMVVLLILSIIMMIIDQMEFKGEHTKNFFSALLPSRWKDTFCAPDVAILLFWVIAAISTLQSDYLFEAFWGNEGRYTGLFLLTLYTAVYFIVSRFWKVKGWILEAFLISGLIMCYIGITDYFQLDILDFRGAIKPEQSASFTSTIGNINTYTAYVALLMAVSAAMFATAKNTLRVIWYYVCMVVAFFAIIMGCSDNAYLAIGALFGFLPFILFKSRTGIRRYLLMAASFITVIQCIDFINQRFADKVIGLDSLFRVIANFSALPVVMALAWVLTLGLYVWDKKRNRKSDDAGVWLVRVWALVLVLGVLALCMMFYDVNVAGNTQRYGSLGSYLLFNDRWGTNRGYIWKKSVELYRNFPIMHKIFGYGPDTFGILTSNYIRFDMINATGQIFDSAHNEYLQYFVTVGPIGLAAYVAYLFSAGWKMVKTRANNGYISGCLFAVLCYGVQALVNLSLPMATPMMLLLLSIGIAAGRTTKTL